jgi:hypothetical protein
MCIAISLSLDPCHNPAKLPLAIPPHTGPPTKMSFKHIHRTTLAKYFYPFLHQDHINIVKCGMGFLGLART